jgi:hypothetical protein
MEKGGDNKKDTEDNTKLVEGTICLCLMYLAKKMPHKWIRTQIKKNIILMWSIPLCFITILYQQKSQSNSQYYIKLHVRGGYMFRHLRGH